MQPRRVKIYFDGGCRPNPGRMEAAVVVRGVVHLFEDMGQGGSFEAEWLALLHAARLARESNLGEVVLLGDARAVIGEAQRALAGDPGSGPYAARLCELAQDGPRLRPRWIKREQNLAGIALARRHPR
ncbi:reverse transcriptase-like protein [Novosphingobium profundi]|uniref:reverse transcriptase-like protein n=1 Tax=Novosphingobium profundi TaxID=1774954 RepID=UPI001BD97CFB|nr:reverse transcriptase-like protein [Novosphingobium profundi]MBT0669094.1 reverse transcriptase-like protein [Novosphingobium profundi]